MTERTAVLKDGRRLTFRSESDYAGVGRDMEQLVSQALSVQAGAFVIESERQVYEYLKAKKAKAEEAK